MTREGLSTFPSGQFIHSTQGPAGQLQHLTRASPDRASLDNAARHPNWTMLALEAGLSVGRLLRERGDIPWPSRSRARSTSTSRTRSPTGSRTRSRSPPEGAPNVLYIVLDDVGFSAMEPFGGLIETPNIKRIADRGLTYTNFHTTALCSPTRSCLLTGRNHTTNGMAASPRRRPASRTRTATSLRVRDDRRGARRARLEHLHRRQVAPDRRGRDEPGLDARRQWPLGRGFERFYGFLGAETNQWYPGPRLRQPSRRAAAARRRRATTSRSTSPTRRSRSSATPRRSRPTSRSSSTTAPAPCHAPHHVPKEWADKYKGKFDMGYEAYRELVFERQKKLGIVTEHGRAVADQPVHRRNEPDGKGWPELDIVRPWDSLTDDEKRLFCADGRGLRRLPQPRRPPARPAARLPRGVAGSSTTR